VHWIEDLLGVSPDGGSGLSELLLAAAATFLGCGVALWRRAGVRTPSAGRRRSRRRPSR
jgi:hypothetical protein